jgi:HJR/Mrr/RecB family endonuclease
MATRTRYNNHKYSKTSADHLIFVLVVILAAALYTHHLSNHISTRLILEIATTIGCFLFLTISGHSIYKKYTGRNIRKKYLEIDRLSGPEFEQYIASILPAQGFSQITLTEHYDRGIDIIAMKDGLRWGIQIKRFSGPVGIGAIRQAVGAMAYYDCDMTMVITNSEFTSRAKELAISNNCSLIEGKDLRRWSKSKYH